MRAARAANINFFAFFTDNLHTNRDLQTIRYREARESSLPTSATPFSSESTYFLLGIRLNGDKNPTVPPFKAAYFLIFVPVTT